MTKPLTLLRTALSWVSTCALASCGGASAPSWQPLAGELLTRVQGGSTVASQLDGRRVELVPGDGRTALRIFLGREDWTFGKKRGFWHATLALPAHGQSGELELRAEGRALPWVDWEELADGEGFSFRNGALVVAGLGDEPPAEAELCWFLARATDEPADRLRARTLGGRGLTLLPGERVRIRVDIPPHSALRFGLALDPLLGGLQEDLAGSPRIRLDGELLFEARPSERDLDVVWHVLALPPQGLDAAELSFEAADTLVHTLFVDPGIGPHEIGTRASRPWPESRPDIVVFLADTFRADNLASCGGTPGVTPHLDALAEQSLCFRRAWSTSAWTLPSHATLFTGHYPPQVLPAQPAGTQLAQEVETVAERLAAHGYRTGAVTDGGFVSSRYGLDQGFAYFSETLGNTKELEGLLDAARAFLEADDGRPTFLFVHTYRAHGPFQASARARAALGERLGIRGQIEDVLAELGREVRVAGAGPTRAIARMEKLEWTPRMRELARELRAHYLGGVSDLDHGLAGFLEELRARGLFEHGYFLFTSDHGEAFGEHETLFHPSDPYDEEVRIPLLIAGRGLTARKVDDPVSLIDVAPTLMAMAGIPALPDWPGRSLLAPLPERALYGFESSSHAEDSLFVLEATRKVLLTCGGDPSTRLQGAFDLGSDPGERNDLSATSAWPRELAARHETMLESLLVPLVEGQAVEMDDEKAAELRALGY